MLDMGSKHFIHRLELVLGHSLSSYMVRYMYHLVVHQLIVNLQVTCVNVCQ